MIACPRRSVDAYCFTTRTTAKANIPNGTWPGSWAGAGRAFAGYNRLYDPDRQPGPIGDVLCWAHTIRTQSNLRWRARC